MDRGACQATPMMTWGVHLSVFYLFAISYCSWGSQGQNTEVVCHSLFQWTTFCQNCPPWPIHLGWPYMAWLSFAGLDKAWMWNISSWLFQQSATAAPNLGCAVGPHGRCYWPWTWGVSSWPLTAPVPCSHVCSYCHFINCFGFVF